MTDILKVRDHSQPCEHDAEYERGERYPNVAYQDGELWLCDFEGCPGGKKIVLRKERGKIPVAAEPWEVIPSEDVWVEVQP